MRKIYDIEGLQDEDEAKLPTIEEDKDEELESI